MNRIKSTVIIGVVSLLTLEVGSYIAIKLFSKSISTVQTNFIYDKSRLGKKGFIEARADFVLPIQPQTRSTLLSFTTHL